ncbi:hypothetical protein AX774_g1774 [Zancudomyces culisetae]|uniref:Uncharacterized protein n=1 Tax=Zancudomyces culisetae TaxID=1213189 RepID=A0A1R1PUP7_ZANCU|nr:hypothetical protein AX774_g1774 [Zancudomyces culisetae]|eukprot:OMH84694.1 hypothetical protein AX774_g1774 [Zancudomyces culisetae]
MVDYEYDDRGSPPKYNGNTTSKRKTKAKIRAPEGRIKFNSKKQRGVINVNRFRKTVRGRRKEVDVNKRSDGIRVDGGMEKEPFGYQLFGVEGRKYSNMVGGGTAGDNPGVITFKSRKNRQRTLKTYYDNSNPTTNNETPKSILPSYMKSKLQGRPKPAARVVDKNKAEYIRSLFPERKNNKSKNRKNTQNRYENENENVNICANVSSNEDNGFAKAVDKKEHLGISDIYQLPSGIYFDKSSFVGKGMVSTILNRLESLLFKNEREINTNTDTEISSTLVNERDIITWLNSLLYSPFDGEFGQTMLIFDKIASYSNVLSTEKSSENLKLMASKMDELSALIKTHMSTLSVEIPAEKKSFFFLNIFVVVLVMKCVLAKVQLSINQDDFGVGENHVARRELHSIVGPKPATIAFGSSNLNTTSDKVALFEQKLNGMLSLCLSSLVELVVDNLDVNKITRKWKYLNTGDSLSIIIGGDDRWSKGENSEGWNIELLVALINLTNYDALCYSNSSIDPAISTFYKSKISGCENIWTALEKHPTISRKNLWNFFIKMMLPLTQFSKKGISSSSTFPYYLGLSPNQTNINNVNSSFQCFLEGFLVDKCDVVSRKSGLSVLHKLTTSNLGTKHTKSIIGGGKCVCQESGFSLALTTRLVYKLHVLYFEEHGKTELQGPADFTYSEFPETCECSEYFFKNRMTMVYLRILYDTFNLWSACLNPTFLKEWRVLVSKILPTKTFSNTSSHNNKNNIAAANTHPNAVEVENGKKTSVLYSLMLFDVILKTTNKDIINPLRLIQQKFNIVDDLLNSVGTNNTSDSAMTNSFASDLLMENWLTTAKIITVRLINFDLEKLNPGTKRRDLSHKNTPNNKKRTDGYYYYDCQRLCIYQWNNYLQKYTQLYLASSCKSFTLQICIDRLLKSATRLLTTSLDHASNANINTGSILPPTGFLGLVYLLLNASLFKSISLGSEIFTFNPQRLALELLEDILTIICKIQKQEHQYVTGALTNANPVNPRHEFGDRTLPNFDSCSNNASKYSGNDISAELHGNNNHQEYSVVFSKIIEVLQTYWVADLRSSIIGMNSKISTNYGKAYSYNLVLLNKRVKALTLLLQILVGHSKMSRYIASNNHNDNNTNPDNTNTTIANNVAFNYNWDSYFLDYGKNSFSIIIDKYLRRLTISMFMSNAIQYLDFEDFARLKSEIVHWWFVMLLDLNLQHYVYKFITEIQLYLANSSSLGNNVRYNQGVGDVDFPVDLLLNLNCSRATSGGGKSNNTLDFLLLESLFKNISNSHYLQSAPVSASAPALVSISTPTPGSTPIMTTTTVPTNLQTSNTLRSLFKTMFDSANEILSNKSLLPHKVSVDDYKTLVFRVKVLFNSYFPSYFIL